MTMNKLKLKFLILFVSLIVALLVFTANADEYDITVELTSDTSLDSVIVKEKSCYIYGNDSDITVILPSIVELSADVRLENLTLSGSSTIYANGHKLYIGSSVTSDSRLTVYGGARNTSVASTELELYGGMYQTVYAGGNGGTITGDTSLVFGGSCNFGDGINDKDATTMSPCNIYGGGNNAAVLGKTNVYFGDNAVAAYIFGAGTGVNGTAIDTNITISGGKVMNVYGGSSSTVLTGCNTHITMTAGMAESIFGASSQSSLIGNTYITLLGGEVTRRVYTGCYNDWTLSWKSSYFVDGTTNLMIGKNMLLNTKSGLAPQNQTNVGVFCGSRCGRNGNANEENTVIFLDDCYESMKNKLGDKSGLGLVFYSHPTYTVDIASGGSISFGDSAGSINCTPTLGKYMTVNDTFVNDSTVYLTKASVDTIGFYDNFGVSSLNVSKDEHGMASVSISYVHENVFEEKFYRMFISVINGDGCTVCIYEADLSKDEYTFVTDIDFAVVNVFFVNDKLMPVSKKYTANVTIN